MQTLSAASVNMSQIRGEVPQMSDIMIDFEKRLCRLEALAGGSALGNADYCLYGKPLQLNDMESNTHRITEGKPICMEKKIYQKSFLMKLRGDLLLKINHKCPSKLRNYHEHKTESVVPPMVSRVVSFDKKDSGLPMLQPIGNQLDFLSSPIFTDSDKNERYERNDRNDRNDRSDRNERYGHTTPRHEKRAKQVDKGFSNCNVPLKSILSNPTPISSTREPTGRSSARRERGHGQKTISPMKNEQEHVEYQYGLVIRGPRDD